MADRVMPTGAIEANAKAREAVCIHTTKIFDSCKDKDCIEDLRVYPTLTSQAYIDNAFSIRPRSAELLHVEIDVAEITFNRCYYTVDVKCFYKIVGDAYPGCNEVIGLAVFDKRVMLFGSDGGVRTFSSDSNACTGNGSNTLPTATVAVVDPIVLSMKLVDPSCHVIPDCELREVSDTIKCCFNEELSMMPTCRRLYVTLGQFSIIRLERDVQLLMPSYDYCIPTKECIGGTEEDPCTLFSKIPFPMDEFFPPTTCSDEDDGKDCCC